MLSDVVSEESLRFGQHLKNGQNLKKKRIEIQIKFKIRSEFKFKLSFKFNFKFICKFKFKLNFKFKSKFVFAYRSRQMAFFWRRPLVARHILLLREDLWCIQMFLPFSLHLSVLTPCPSGIDPISHLLYPSFIKALLKPCDHWRTFFLLGTTVSLLVLIQLGLLIIPWRLNRDLSETIILQQDLPIVAESSPVEFWISLCLYLFLQMCCSLHHFQSLQGGR